MFSLFSGVSSIVSTEKPDASNAAAEVKKATEMKARKQAEEERKRAAEESRKQIESERRKAAEEAASKRAAEVAARKQEEERKRAEEERKRVAEEAAAKRTAEIEANKRAEEERRKAAEETRKQAEKERRKAAEVAATKRAAEVKARKQAEEERIRAAEENRKRAEEGSRKADTRMEFEVSKKQEAPTGPRPTFSLFGLGGGVSSQPKTELATTPSAMTRSAPRGVPTISKWKLNPNDNTISGFISGSSSFKNGEPVTTSVIVGDAVANSVVRTKSGSR